MISTLFSLFSNVVPNFDDPVKNASFATPPEDMSKVHAEVPRIELVPQQTAAESHDSEMVTTLEGFKIIESCSKCLKEDSARPLEEPHNLDLSQIYVSRMDLVPQITEAESPDSSLNKGSKDYQNFDPCSKCSKEYPVREGSAASPHDDSNSLDLSQKSAGNRDIPFQRF